MVRKRHQGAHPIVDFRYHAIGAIRVVLGYVFGNLVEVDERFRVQRIPAHTGLGRRWRWDSVFSIKRR